MLSPKYPRVVQWVEQTADAWDERGETLSFPEITAFGQTILKEMARTYKYFILATEPPYRTNKRPS